MTTRILSALLIVSFGAAFAQDPAPASDPAKAGERKLGLAKPIVMDAEKEVYGAQLQNKPVATLAEIAKDSKAWSGKEVQVRGKITSVCPKKGCWMLVKDGETQVRVGFTGYKFFVPLDAAGRDVAVEGTVEVKVETEAQRRHYAQDAGKSPEEIAKITGDQTTLSVTADAVQIGKLPPLPKKEGCCEDAKEGAAKSGACEEKKDGAGGCCGEKKEGTGGCCGEKKTGATEEKKPAGGI